MENKTMVSMYGEDMRRCLERCTVDQERGLVDILKFPLTEVVFNVGVDKIIEHSAIIRMEDLGKEFDSLIDIHLDPLYKLEKQTGREYRSIFQGVLSLADQSFILGFIEGYKMMMKVSQIKSDE